MAGAVADISLRAGDAGGEPLAVLHGNKPVLAAMPDLDGHPDVAEVEPPASQLRRAVIPPALVARTQSDLVGFGEPLGQVPGQNLGVDGREEALELFSELFLRGPENPFPGLAEIAARCLRVGEERLSALYVGLAHPGEVVKALDSVRRDRRHRGDGDSDVRQQSRAREGVRAAPGYTPDAEPVVPEPLGDGPDVVCSRRHGVTGV